MDKYRGITRLPLVESKIDHLLGRLSANRALGSYSTQEELIRAYADICNRILQGFDKRVYDLPKAVVGVPVNEVDINLYLLGVYSEIMYMLTAVKNTAEMAEENFNFAIARIRSLQADMKYCRQQLSTFTLYTTQFGDTQHFGETFSNETNIDKGSSLLGQEECFIDLAEGTISLPRLEDNDEWKIESIKVGANSNGLLGNNIEAKVPVRGAIGSMYDGNVDTWTEYERIVGIEDAEGLKLELKINLEDVQPVNGIKIHPVFLGARTPLSIQVIEVSQDGRRWVSLKDDVRVASFLDEDPEERYHLSPQSSRFAGEFNITFSPRFVKFIRLLIKQSSAFSITDVYGARWLRYAVAIKEIEIYGHKYSSIGELVSKQIPFIQSISALGLSSLVDPPNISSDIGGVEYFISYDDGASWNQMTSLEEANVNIPEVLYPPSEISSIRYKLHLFKNELAFAQQKANASAIPFSERFTWSTRRPFTLNLFHPPVSGTITVCDPEVATRGKIYPRKSLGTGVNSSLVEESGGGNYRRHGNTELRLKLPLAVIQNPADLYLYVNNTLWIRVSNTSSFTNQWSRQYVLNRSLTPEGNFGGDWEVIFGNNDAENPKGRIPSSSDEVSIYLSEELCVVEGLASPYKLKLDYASDGVKENTLIRSYGEIHSTPPETIPGGTTKFVLQNKNILFGTARRGKTYYIAIRIRDSSGYIAFVNNISIFPPVSGSFRQFKDFVDGYSELSTDGDWTVDSEEGVIYLYEDTPTENDKEYTVTYWWEDVVSLNLSDWDFVEGKLDEINVYESGYITRDSEIVLSSIASAGDYSTIITISTETIKGIVSKSLRIQGGELAGYRAFEVPFIDGHTEFEGRAKIQDEIIPSSTSGSDSFASFRLAHWQSIITTAAPSFSDIAETYFKVEKANLVSCTIAGDYYFDAIGTEVAGAGYIYVHMGGVGIILPSGYAVSYQYTDEFSAERMKGAYSINSDNGVVYFASALTSSDLSKTIVFKYTSYKARYNVSLQLKEDIDYEVDIENSLIRILSGAASGVERYLSVNYKYQPEELTTTDLAPYFSPLVRAIDIKVS